MDRQMGYNNPYGRPENKNICTNLMLLFFYGALLVSLFGNNNLSKKWNISADISGEEY